jgi:hypothetical protein
MPLSASKIDSAADVPARYVPVALIIILVLASLVLAAGYMPNYGAGVDEASYFLAAKGLALHGDPAYHNPDPMVFVPENMVETRPGWFYPKYPIGYPLLGALAYRAGMWLGAGPEAPFLVNPILMLLAVAGVYFLSRHFLDRLFSLAITLMMALHPVLLFYGVAALSHASDLACTVWCLYFGYAWFLRPNWKAAAAAGLLLGFGISIRYTDTLLLLPLAWLLAMRMRRPLSAAQAGAAAVRPMLGHAALAATMALVGIAPLLWFHWRAFGSLLATGYSLTQESAAFSLGNFLAHLPLVLTTFCSLDNGVFLLFPVALAGLVYACWKKPEEGVFLALWCVPVLLLYTAYYWVNVRFPLLYIRFFLTLFPGLLIAVFLLLHAWLWRRLPARIAVVVVLIVQAGMAMERMTPFIRIEGTADVDRIATALVRRALPSDSVVLADTFLAYSLVYYTDMTILYPRYFAGKWVRERLLTPDQKNHLPADFNPLRARRFAEALGGLTDAQLAEALRQRLTAYAHEGRTVALVVEGDSEKWQVLLGGTFSLTPVGQDDRVIVYRLDLRVPPPPGQP